VVNDHCSFLQRFGGTGGAAVSFDGSESSQPSAHAQDKEEWEVTETAVGRYISSRILERAKKMME